MWGREEIYNDGWLAGGRSECRFSGVRGGHRCGVDNSNLVVFQQWPAMWGMEERLNGGQQSGEGMNADLAVSMVARDGV